MNIRAIVTGLTALAGLGLLVCLGIFFFGSAELAGRLPASLVFAAAIVTLAGMVTLKATEKPPGDGKRRQSTLATVVFAILVVVALLLVGDVLLRH